MYFMVLISQQNYMGNGWQLNNLVLWLRILEINSKIQTVIFHGCTVHLQHICVKTYTLQYKYTTCRLHDVAKGDCSTQLCSHWDISLSRYLQPHRSVLNITLCSKFHKHKYKYISQSVATPKGAHAQNIPQI